MMPGLQYRYNLVIIKYCKTDNRAARIGKLKKIHYKKYIISLLQTFVPHVSNLTAALTTELIIN